jgi:nucleoside-diphosphate-sugar epimerase
MIRIAVLGASGFIGTRLVEMFTLDELAEVRPVVRSYSSLARSSRFELDARVADAFDQVGLEKAFQGCDVVVHAVAGDSKTILGTLAPVYGAAQKAGVRRLVYLSSASVHGQAPEPGTDERSPLSDRQALGYNNARVRAERELWRLRSHGAVEVVVLRPGIVFGPRSSWVIRFADDLLAGKAYLLNRGRGICNSIYVDNLIHAVHLVATKPETDGEVFLVGDQERVTWADLYRPIAEGLGFDLADLPEGELIERDTSWMERMESMRVSKPAQAMLSVFLLKLRQAAYLAYQYLLDPQLVDAAPAVRPERLPAATREMAMLYSCLVKLPDDKARRILGYQPVVSFQEACRRTAAWLAFAGYPVTDQRQRAGSRGAFHEPTMSLRR